MDKYGLSNETRAAQDDSSALYHMLLCGSGAAVEGRVGRRRGFHKGVGGRGPSNLSVSSLIRSWLSDTMVVLCERK